MTLLGIIQACCDFHENDFLLSDVFSIWEDAIISRHHVPYIWEDAITSRHHASIGWEDAIISRHHKSVHEGNFPDIVRNY